MSRFFRPDERWVPADARARHAAGQPIGSTAARDALYAAGLGEAWDLCPVAETVGDTLLTFPDRVAVLDQGEETRIAEAQYAALLGAAWLEYKRAGRAQSAADIEAEVLQGDEENRTALLLSGTAHREGRDYYFTTTGGARLLSSDSLQRHAGKFIWVAFQVVAMPHRSDVEYVYLPKACVSGVRSPRLPLVDKSLAFSLCHMVVVQHLLPLLDLQGFVPDVAASRAFLDRAHRDGVPATCRTPRWDADGSPTKASFGERLAHAMAHEQRPDALPMPAPRLVKGHRDAELYAAEVVRALGFHDATATALGADGGVDVQGSGVVAQVKMEALPVGRPVVQGIQGIASVEQATALVFSLSGYTEAAVEWAERAGVALYEFAFDGTVEPRSLAASRLLQNRPGPRDETGDA